MCQTTSSGTIPTSLDVSHLRAYFVAFFPPKLVALTQSSWSLLSGPRAAMLGGKKYKRRRPMCGRV